MEKTFNWFKVADQPDAINFQLNNTAIILVNEKVITLGKHHDKIFAFAYQCPHAGAIMAEGRIDARGNIICPLHGYKFSLANGSNTSGEGYKLKTWPVEHRPDGIFVGLERSAESL